MCILLTLEWRMDSMAIGMMLGGFRWVQLEGLIALEIFMEYVVAALL